MGSYKEDIISKITKMGGKKSWPSSLCHIPCRTTPQTDSRCPSPTSDDRGPLLLNPSARVPESQRSARMSDIYCMLSDDDESECCVRSIVSDITEQDDTMTLVSNETLSVSSQHDLDIVDNEDESKDTYENEVEKLPKLNFKRLLSARSNISQCESLYQPKSTGKSERTWNWRDVVPLSRWMTSSWSPASRVEHDAISLLSTHL